MTNHVARNTPSDHIISFYRDFEDIRAEKFDGFIVTGAPVETMPFEDVTYWNELCEVFDWTLTNVHSTFNVCWGAQAAVHHFHGMPKYPLQEKAFGVYRHRNLAHASPYLRGFSDDFSVPVSRWTEVRRADIPEASGLQVLMESDETGLCMLHDPAHRALHMFNHIEYDSSSLADEYFRDRFGRQANRDAGPLFSEERSDPPAGKPLAQPRASAVRQLDQRALPDDAVRRGEDRGDAGVDRQGRRVDRLRLFGCPETLTDVTSVACKRNLNRKHVFLLMGDHIA